MPRSVFQDANLGNIPSTTYSGTMNLEVIIRFECRNTGQRNSAMAEHKITNMFSFLFCMSMNLFHIIV